MASRSPMPPVNTGISNDVGILLEAFKAKQSVRLVKFYEIVAEYELINIYCGRLGVTDLLEFEECVLKTTFTYVRSKNDPTTKVQSSCFLTEQIFGVYAMYVLYYSQPTDYVSKIFVTSNDIRYIIHLITDILLPLRHLDTVACLHKLFSDDAFSIVAFVICYDPVCHHRHEASHREVDGIDNDNRYTPMEGTKGIMQHPILKTMASVQQKMQEKQKLIPNFYVAGDPENDFLANLDKIYDTFQRRIEEVDTGKTSISEMDASTSMNEREDSSANMMKSRSRSIKDQAYSSSVTYSRSRRYADPNMIENFPNVTIVEEDNVMDKSVPSTSILRTKRKHKAVTKNSTTASHAADESVTSEDRAIENSSPSKSHSKSKTVRKSKTRLPDAEVNEEITNKIVPSMSLASKKRKGLLENSTTTSTAAVDDSAVPEGSASKISSRNRTMIAAPRKRKLRKEGSSTRTPLRRVSCFDSEEEGNVARGDTHTLKKPLRPRVDAAFEAEIKRMEALLEDPEDERLKILLGS